MPPADYQQGAGDAIDPLSGTERRLRTALHRLQPAKSMRAARCSRQSSGRVVPVSGAPTSPPDQLSSSGALHRLQSQPGRFCRGVVHPARTGHASGIWATLLRALVGAPSPGLDGCSFHIETRWWSPCGGHRWLERHQLARGHQAGGLLSLLVHSHFKSCFACFTHLQTVLL